jgi:hypothetical protein
LEVEDKSNGYAKPRAPLARRLERFVSCICVGVLVMTILDDLFLDISGSRGDAYAEKIVSAEPRLIKLLTVFTLLLGSFGFGLDIGISLLR